MTIEVEDPLVEHLLDAARSVAELADDPAIQARIEEFRTTRSELITCRRMGREEAWIHNMTMEFCYAERAVIRKEEILQMLSNILGSHLPEWTQTPFAAPSEDRYVVGRSSP